MKKIKVAQVITRMDWGGAPDVVRNLCLGLDPESYEVHLITGKTQHPSGKTLEFLAAFKGRVHTVEALQREPHLFNDSIALCALATLFSREKFDIVHTHTAKAGALGRLAARFAGARACIHTPHGHNLYGYFGKEASGAIRAAEKGLSCITDKVIALTDLERDDLVRLGVAPAEKVTCIPQGLDISAFLSGRLEKPAARRRLSIPEDVFVIGMIGRLEPVKGARFFIDAACDVARGNQNAFFLIAGEGSLRPELQAAVASAELDRSFLFSGWRDDVAQAMSALDLLVLPSLNEAVGMVLIEAQSLGCPVIATAVGGVPEIVSDRQTGILVPPADAASLSAAMTRCIADHGMAARMGRAGAAWVKDRFCVEKMVSTISDLYMDTIGRLR